MNAFDTCGEFKISEFIQVINQERPVRLFHLIFHKFTKITGVSYGVFVEKVIQDD